MQTVLRYRGRAITEDDVLSMRRLIAGSPGSSRRELSRLVCEDWDWRQANGALRDMVCRSLMLLLHRGGHIELPAPRRVTINNAAKQRSGKALPPDLDRTPIEGKLSDLGPLQWRQVRRTADEDLFDGLLAEHHYLGRPRLIGEHLKFLVLAQGRPVACFAWSSPPHKLQPRDRFIGWSRSARDQNRHLIAYNPRFLIPQWVKVKHLASHLLGHMARVLPGEWQRAYGHPVCYLETFVDCERYAGTCYHAANWIVLGKTAGRGNNAPTHAQTRSIKEVLGYPLSKDFRERLGRMA